MDEFGDQGLHEQLLIARSESAIGIGVPGLPRALGKPAGKEVSIDAVTLRLTGDKLHFPFSCELTETLPR